MTLVMATGAILPFCASAVVLSNSALQPSDAQLCATLTALFQISSNELKKRNVAGNDYAGYWISEEIFNK